MPVNPGPADPSPTVDTTAVSPTDPAAPPAPDARSIECMAKVIVHEAANQTRRGQIAVAQVIRARMKRFGGDVCEVVRKPGQFFNVDSYSPPRGSKVWATAVEIATSTLQGEGDEVVPGALFFHTAGHPMKGRIRLAQIDRHVFYR